MIRRRRKQRGAPLPAFFQAVFRSRRRDITVTAAADADGKIRGAFRTPEPCGIAKIKHINN